MSEPTITLTVSLDFGSLVRLLTGSAPKVADAKPPANAWVNEPATAKQREAVKKFIDVNGWDILEEIAPGIEDLADLTKGQANDLIKAYSPR